MSSFYQNKDTDLSKQTDTPQSAYLTKEIIMTWLERMVLSKTFEADPLELEKDIIEIRALLDEEVDREEVQQ